MSKAQLHLRMHLLRSRRLVLALLKLGFQILLLDHGHELLAPSSHYEGGNGNKQSKRPVLVYSTYRAIMVTVLNLWHGD